MSPVPPRGAAVSARESWLAVVQDGDKPDEQETEVVTLAAGLHGQPGDAIEISNGVRIVLVERAAA